MEELGYYPNEIARSLFGQKTNSIGVLFPNLSDPFFGEMITKIENLLGEKNYKVLICNTDNNLERETKYLKMLLANQVDGIIVGSHNKPSEIYNKANLPIVAIDRFVSKNVPIVRSDNYEGGCLATEYLLKKKCQQIALFSGSSYEEVRKGELRSKGYFDTMEKNHKQTHSCYVEFEEDIKYQESKMTQFLQENPDIDGAFVTGDALAGLLFNIAENLGRNIEIVGYDGTDVFTRYFRNFTTVKQPINQMAQKAVDVLLASIDGHYEEKGMEFVFPVKLVKKL